jgi:hypothetical protein
MKWSLTSKKYCDSLNDDKIKKKESIKTKIEDWLQLVNIAV